MTPGGRDSTVGARGASLELGADGDCMCEPPTDNQRIAPGLSRKFTSSTPTGLADGLGPKKLPYGRSADRCAPKGGSPVPAATRDSAIQAVTVPTKLDQAPRPFFALLLGYTTVHDRVAERHGKARSKGSTNTV